MPAKTTFYRVSALLFFVFFVFRGYLRTGEVTGLNPALRVFASGAREVSAKDRINS